MHSWWKSCTAELSSLPREEPDVAGAQRTVILGRAETGISRVIERDSSSLCVWA